MQGENTAGTGSGQSNETSYRGRSLSKAHLNLITESLVCVPLSSEVTKALPKIASSTGVANLSSLKLPNRAASRTRIMLKARTLISLRDKRTQYAFEGSVIVISLILVC